MNAFAEALTPFKQQYEAAHMQPLQITAHFDTPVVAYYSLHFDAILSHAVFTRAIGNITPFEDYLHIPLPLAALWHSPTGVPLWASTDMIPHEDAIRDELWLHRRALEPNMTHQNISTVKGRHKEKRTPLPALNTQTLTCFVIGDPNAIADLLRDVGSIGKKRHIAGAVRQWEIVPAPAFALQDEQFRLLRPVPVSAVGEFPIDTPFAWLGFSPPYWHTATHQICMPPGYSPGNPIMSAG